MVVYINPGCVGVKVMERKIWQQYYSNMEPRKWARFINKFVVHRQKRQNVGKCGFEGWI